MVGHKFNLLYATVFVVCSLPACSSTSTANPSGTTNASDSDLFVIDEINLHENHDESDDYNWDRSQEISIVLNTDTISVDGAGAVVDGSTVTINSAGSYSITGTLSDGQIVVNSNDDEIVRLIFNGIDIYNSSTAPINIISAEKTIIVLVENSQNTITDSNNYIFNDPEEDEPDAAIFSKDNLTISGEGSLTVNGNYNEGIKSKDGLIISSGNITVNSVDDGIQGKDYLVIKNGTISINAGGDGFKSNNDKDAEKGYIAIDNGLINITAGSDAIQAETHIVISDGDLTLTTGGGSSVLIGADDSAKGIKAGISITVDDGTFNIDSADDGLHADNRIVIHGGLFNLASGDDAVHSDASLEINGGEINVSESYEGIESGLITINDGYINLYSRDDALNAAYDNGNSYLYINGGRIIIDSEGDGVDVNGFIEMSGGTLIVNGPTANFNAALDFDDSFVISGGTLVAVGSSRMAQAPGNTSAQNSVLLTFDTTYAAGTLFHIQDSNGTTIFSFSPTKTYQSIAFSSDLLKTGVDYDIYLGGSSSGINNDGLYLDGVYTAGSYYGQITISNTLTVIR